MTNKHKDRRKVGKRRRGRTVDLSKSSHPQAKAILQMAVPELIWAVECGEISVSTARQLVRLYAHEQRQVVAEGSERAKWWARKIKQLRRMPDIPSKYSQYKHAYPKRPPIYVVEPNSVVLGDCRNLIPALPDESINLCVTSPPYADQRKGMYPGIPESEYPDFTVDWMSKLRDKLADDGSVLIVIRPHLRKGVISDYVLRTRLALRDAGWFECEKLIWLKTDGGACMGSYRRPRRAYEEILWFSKTHDPYIDTKECGHWAKKISFRGSTRFGTGSKKPVHSSPNVVKQAGKTRTADVISIPVGRTAKGVMHPAMFPEKLAAYLIRTYCPPSGVVLDNFAGSGSSLIAAKELGRSFIGFDVMEEYVDLAQKRLKDVDPPAFPQAC